MSIGVKKQAAIPAGRHEGIVISCEETTTTFDQQKGPEPVVKITIQPKWENEGGDETLPVSISYTPVLNGISALSKMLKRLGAHPADGEEWEPASLHGTEVSFTSRVNDRGFVQVLKDSIQPL